MCCSPDHVGAPPEWHRELADEGPPVPVRGRGITPATLAALARVLKPRAFLDSPRRPVSTEGGSGRAVPTVYGPSSPPAYRPPVSFTELAAWNPARRIERDKRKGARP